MCRFKGVTKKLPLQSGETTSCHRADPVHERPGGGLVQGKEKGGKVRGSRKKGIKRERDTLEGVATRRKTEKERRVVLSDPERRSWQRGTSVRQAKAH